MTLFATEHGHGATGYGLEPLSEGARALLDATPEALVAFDVETCSFAHANPIACELLGYSLGELRELSPWRCSPTLQPDGRASLDAARLWITAAAHGATPSFEWVHCTQGGEPLPCCVRLHRYVEGGRTLVIGRLVPREASLDDEPGPDGLRGALFASVARDVFHDLDNLLLAIQLSSGELLRGIEDDSPLHTSAATARLAAEHAESIIGATRRAFLRDDGVDAEVDATLQALTPLVRCLVGCGSVELHLGAAGCRSPLSEAALAKVVLRYVVDAARSGSRCVVIGTRAWSDESVDVWVTDDRLTRRALAERDGSGVTPTRPATPARRDAASRLVEEVGGRVDVKSWPGIGQRVQILLPRTE